MPNWCEGTLKIRGKYENIMRWCNDKLCVYEDKIENGEWVRVPNYNLFKIEEYDDCGYFECSLQRDAYIEGTRRNFVAEDFDCSADENGNARAALKVQAAWYFEYEPYLEMAKEYNLDFRFYGFECGMQFNQEIIIENGELIADNEIKYDDYFWECPCPTLGG